MSEAIKNAKIKLSEKLGFMFFSTSTNIIFNFKSAYYLLFLTNVLYVPVLTASTILTLGTIWDAVNDPLIGFWSVNHKFKNGEKVRPLALWFALPWAITIVLMFSNFNLSSALTIAACLIIYFFFEAFYTFLAIPYNSMGALATNDDADRRSINSFRSLGGTLGSGIGAVAVLPIVKLFGGLKGENAIIGPTDAPALFKTALLMAVLCIAGCLAHYFTTKERVHQESDNEEKIGFLETFKMLFAIKPWVLNMMYILCYGIDTAIMLDSINYYAAYILGASSKATPIMAGYLVVAIISALTIGKIDKKLGRTKTMALAALVQVVTKIPFIINPFSIVNIYLNAAGVGFGGTVAFIMFNTNRNNITDIVEFKYGRRIDSMVATCDNLISKTAEALAVQAMGIFLAKAGMDAALGASQPQSAISAICILLGWVPAVVSLVMAVFAIKNDIVGDYNKAKEAYNNLKN
ncbi:MAG: MFS transporter [Erysipelotrichaceae bacterium]|nr:MFS transporter [Erysipelotrichaceae bacterium]